MPGRRSLLQSMTLFALTLPACMHVNAHVSPKPTAPAEPAATTTSAARGAAEAPAPRDFAVLPKAPGTVVATKPAAPVTTSPTTAQKLNDGAGVSPPNSVKAAGTEPAAFPALPTVGVTPEAPILAAVRAYTEGRPEQAIESIRKMDKASQDFVLAVLPVLARGAGTDLAKDPATAAALVDQLRGAAARLEPLAALKVEKVAICGHVAGFGRFVQRAENYTYKPNERVQLYVELRNLGTQVTGDGFLTHVRAAAEVRDAKNLLVPQVDPDNHRRVPVVKFEDQFVTRSPLQDFHILYSFPAPAAPGVYTVTLQLSDASGRRTVKSPPVEFRVAGP